MAVEALSEMFEKPPSELAKLKVDILDKTTYCNKRRVILLVDTAQGLKTGMYTSILNPTEMTYQATNMCLFTGKWEFNVDLNE